MIKGLCCSFPNYVTQCLPLILRDTRQQCLLLLQTEIRYRQTLLFSCCRNQPVFRNMRLFTTVIGNDNREAFRKHRRPPAILKSLQHTDQALQAGT